MKTQLKNMVYMLCFIFFMFGIAPSCSDDQASTGDDTDLWAEAFEDIETEQVEVTGDDEDTDRRRKGRRNRKMKQKNQQAKTLQPDETQEPTTTNPIVAETQSASRSPSGACIQASSDYLACRYEESRQIVDATLHAKQASIATYEKYSCAPASNNEDALLKTNIQVILIEYKYAGLTPKNALVCEIQAEEQVLGYAHHTQGFCRDNLTARIDSLREALTEYARLGYACHKAGESLSVETPQSEPMISETQESDISSKDVPIPDDLIPEE